MKILLEVDIDMMEFDDEQEVTQIFISHMISELSSFNGGMKIKKAMIIKQIIDGE